ncbi:short-chain dehydrogenase/reductase SDR [Kipferlia bialata]|uniref:Short-chain dehydrogenase/reductase SDR n=1 Tax=Kipferlia bialata TaxID=797122 RepID=A0A9K3D3G0_9EUKA|nr:short-chain dehydrogenase/reductase SDR [Kipferlia bialata]|eukprot:g8843.t1
MSYPELKGQVVLVTGSTAGIGRAIAEEFVSQGCVVIVNSRRQAKVDETVAALTAMGSSAVYGVAADIGTAEGVTTLTEYVGTLNIEVDILVNNAGMFGPLGFFETTRELWDSYWATNVMSAAMLSQHYLQRMLERGKGRILTISSEAALKPLSHMLPYSVSKTALLSLSRGMAELTKVTPSEVSKTVAFLSSDGAAAINGSAMRCEGGIVRHL